MSRHDLVGQGVPEESTLPTVLTGLHLKRWIIFSGLSTCAPKTAWFSWPIANSILK